MYKDFVKLNIGVHFPDLEDKTNTLSLKNDIKAYLHIWLFSVVKKTHVCCLNKSI